MQMRNHKLLLMVCLSLSLSSAACLKTRAQLKDQDKTEREVSTTKTTPTPVQEVQGQYVMDEIKSELTRISGRIEDLERTQKQGNQNAATANKEELKKIENRIAELEQAQANMIEALKKLQETQAQAQVEPKELLEKAKSQMDAGQKEAAVETLTAYLKNPKAKKSEEATYMRAEAYYALKQYKKAIVDYSKFPEKYTKSTHLPSALLKIGLSFEALGMKEDAKGFYQELVEKFPKSSEAKKAKAKLK